jgi:hypothetical protein
MNPASKAKQACKRLLSFIQLYGQHLPLACGMLFSMRCRVVLLRGTMKGGGSLSLLYAGRGKNYHYLLKHLFEECAAVEEQKTTLPAYGRHLARLEPRADVVVLDIGWPYHRPINRNGRYLEVPDWLNMDLELADSWEETVRLFRHTTRRQDLRHIRLEGYRCEATSDRAALERFYDTMYLPFIGSRHGHDAVKASRRHVIRRGRQGCLLQIFKEDRVVVAGVVYPDDGVLFFLWMGMPADCIDEPPRAAVSALYYFGIRHAHDHDLWAVDFTGSRAFLDDGAFRFKRKWGAVADDSFSPSSLLIRPKNGHLDAARFCQRFPVAARRGGALEGLFLCLDEKIDDEWLERLDAQYGCEGIDRMTVVDCSGNTEAGGREISIGQRTFRVIAAGPANFADHFAKQAAASSP